MNIGKSELDPRTAWRRYCGFLDMSGQAFSNTQVGLLQEQLSLTADTPSGRSLTGGAAPRTVDGFRSAVPLTTYDDYPQLANWRRRDQGLRGRHIWAYTQYGAGNEKWIPYTSRAYERFLDNIMAGLLLAAASRPGDVRIRPGDRALYNVPPRPYLAGHASFGLIERFGIRGLLDPEQSEAMEFKARVRAGFNAALQDRVDVIISMSSILLKVGERFEKNLGSAHEPTAAPRQEGRMNGRALGRMVSAKLRSVIGRRPVRPYDLWHPKAVLGWGMDTRFVGDRISNYWGRAPFELYASTEGGVMGVQARPGGGMVFNPYSAFYEFIPEAELGSARTDPERDPGTVLLDEVEPGAAYELVITNFHGMPLLRYRTGHLLRFTGVQSHECGPEFEFIGRSDERIDIAGFTRIDESTVWSAISNAGIPVREWALRREDNGDEPALHLYAECASVGRSEMDESTMAERLHRSMKSVDPLYRDLEDMLGIRPLKVTSLPAGTFDAYYEAKRLEGRPLAQRRPERMNADDSSILALLAAGGVAGVTVRQAGGLANAATEDVQKQEDKMAVAA